MGRKRSRFASAALSSTAADLDDSKHTLPGSGLRAAEPSAGFAPPDVARSAQSHPGPVTGSRTVEKPSAIGGFRLSRGNRGQTAKRRRASTSISNWDVGQEEDTENDDDDDGLADRKANSVGFLSALKSKPYPGTAASAANDALTADNDPERMASPESKDEDELDEFMKHLQPDQTLPGGGTPKSSQGDGGLAHEDIEETDPDYVPEPERDGFLDRAKKRRPVYERVNHGKISYEPFVKDLYRAVPEVAHMSHEEVLLARQALGSIRVRGRGCPAPINSFGQCGLSSAALDVIRRAGYVRPTAVQSQAIPCIMSGRDLIGIAKTGSGKTLAFLLPALRHVAIQKRPDPGDGPIALLIAPTRELATQIYTEAKKFTKPMGLRCVCAYGGSGLKDQIAELKRAADIVVCTPGRMIDLLAMNSGRITNLRRVTFVVLDEADRMFDMGFEPQLTRLVDNVRPDRQTVMFSATFPPQVERLARNVLKQPIEVVVGGRSVAASNIVQHVEVRTEESKFRRLLQLLGLWYERGSILVFVDRQDNADRIFRELSSAGYQCLSLHGGMDQADRDSAVADFKNGVIRVLVATSVAARGLDVKNLSLVVNFDVPNHYEDYVHRVGRTGRAGKKGTAYTFLTHDQTAYAPDLVKALELSAKAGLVAEAAHAPSKEELEKAARASVPEDLRKLANAFEQEREAKRKAGEKVYGSSSGYGGRGFTFTEDEENAKASIREQQAKRFRAEVGDGDSESDDERGGALGLDDAEIKVVDRRKAATERAAINGMGGASPNAQSAADHTAREVVATADADVDGKLRNIVTTSKSGPLQGRPFDSLRKDGGASIGQPASAGAVPAKASHQETRKADSAATDLRINGGTAKSSIELSAAAAAAAAASARLSASGKSKPPVPSGAPSQPSLPRAGAERYFEAELEFNDYPQHARWQVTRANALTDVTENTGCVVTTRGKYFEPGRNPPAGERRLHLLIEGDDERSVRAAYREIKLKLEEAAAARPSDRGASYSKYSVV